MKHYYAVLSILFISITNIYGQNAMMVPSTLIGPNINLTLQEGTTDFYPGVTTNTLGANGNLLGPTLILDKNAFVSLNVDNQLTDTTTIHWHGMHVAPENDGGPHSIILPGDSWNPQFTVLDKAGLYWYHPHLHMQTDKHVSKGIAGLIIVRDNEEASLNLPMSYGIDEFPIIMQTKGFDVTGQIEVHTEMDTSVMVNGTIDAFVDLPSQVVRLRVLNGSSQRVYELGFSDNRNFSLIGTDGGLLTGPVSLNRYRMAPGQRADILVDLSTSLGQNIQLINYASELPNGVYGATQPGMGMGASIPGYTSNPLNGSNFQVLDINVVAQTASPILSIPSSLAVFTPLLEPSANITRDLLFTSASGMGNITGPFLINGTSFNMGVINYTVPIDNIEIWSLTNETPIGHPFHIHDVQFYILDINGVPPPPELQGLNDVVFVPAGMGNVRFIAQFSDFANDTIPFMYHCHMLTHEDMGMMGQFIVSDPNSGLNDGDDYSNAIKIYPNPSLNGTINIDLSEFNNSISSYELRSTNGELINEAIVEIGSSSILLPVHLSSGTYFINLTSDSEIIHRKVIVN